jgi:predicted nucleotidyltransferase
MSSNDRTRVRIARVAAQLMYERLESEYFQAKRKAARQLGFGESARDLPSNREIREFIDEAARLCEGDEERAAQLASMRAAALWLMRLLPEFRPRLIGSVLKGGVRAGSDIDVHVFCDDLFELTEALDRIGFRYRIERQEALKGGRAQAFTRVRVFDRHEFELTVHEAEEFRNPAKSSITGKAMERATAPELEALIRREHPGLDLEAEFAALDAGGPPPPEPGTLGPEGFEAWPDDAIYY